MVAWRITLKNILWIAALILTAQWSIAAEPIESNGEENYMRFCAACHGASGKGDGPVSSAIVQAVPDLTGIAARNKGNFPRDIVSNAIDSRWRIDAHGTKVMPVWGYEFWVGAGEFSDLGVAVIVDGLVDYLESIQTDADQPASSK